MSLVWSAGDEQVLDPWAQQPAARRGVDLAGVGLGVDDGDAARADGEVVDIGSAAWKAPGVQEQDVAVGEERFQALGDELFAMGAARPCLLMVGLGQTRQADTGRSTMCRPSGVRVGTSTMRVMARDGGASPSSCSHGNLNGG
jgi:hypothetical protein